MSTFVEDYWPLLVLLGIVLFPALVTVSILICRKPDHPQKANERRGFPVEPNSPDE